MLVWVGARVRRQKDGESALVLFPRRSRRPGRPSSSITATGTVTTRPAAANTAAELSSSAAGCSITTRPTTASASVAPARPAARLAGVGRRRKAWGAAALLLLPSIILVAILASSLPTAHACDHHHDAAAPQPTTATTTTPWPDAVSPATRRRLLATATAAATTTTTAHHRAWSHPLGLDRHGRRRSLLTSTLRRCGTHAPDPATHQKLERAHAIRAAREAAFSPADGDASTASSQQQRTIEIPTYVTVVLRDNHDGPTLVSDATVQAQLDTLNKAYGTTANSPYKFAFVLKAPVARAKAGSPSAAGMCDQAIEAKIKKERRQGGPGALNLYIADLSDCGLLGFSSWPWDLASKGEVDDGVAVHHMTLPGGTYKPYNMGFTAVHEIGHWLGLYHTFQNGCTGAGDSVDDTNYTATPIEGCPKARDTCSQPGGDPVTNPMDYTDDACMQTFTVGQHQRMESLYRMYRGGSASSDGGKERGRPNKANKG